MKYLKIIPILVLAFSCTKADFVTPNEAEVDSVIWEMDATPTHRLDCTPSDFKKKQVELDRLDYETFYVEIYRIKNGPDKTKWHNPTDGYAMTFYDLNDQPFLWRSHNVQISEDVVQKIRGNDVRFEKQIRISNGIKTIIHGQNTYETDIDGIPAVTKIDVQTGDTICIGHYECDVFISGCRY